MPPEVKAAMIQDRSEPGVSSLPSTISSALISASHEISQGEPWVTRRGLAGSTVPRLMAVLLGLGRKGGHDSKMRQYIREKCLRLLAYMPAEIRLMSMVELARKSPDTLDDLFTGKIAEDVEIFRYNLLTSLGVFSRHGLVAEVFTKDRAKTVRRLMDDARRRTDARGK